MTDWLLLGTALVGVLAVLNIVLALVLFRAFRRADERLRVAVAHVRGDDTTL